MQNKTSFFCLAMIELDMRDNQIRNHFKEAYISVDGRDLGYNIALLYDSLPDFNYSFKEIISLPNGKFLAICPIMDEYKQDFDFFKQGQYSRFNKKIKQKIAEYFGWNSRVYYATIKHPSLRLKLEKQLDIKVSEDTELYSIINFDEETYHYNLTTNGI